MCDFFRWKKKADKKFMSDTLTRWRLDARKKALSKTGEGAKPPLTGFEALVLEVFSNPNLPDGVRVRLVVNFVANIHVCTYLIRS